MAKAQTKSSSPQTKATSDLLQISIDNLPGTGNGLTVADSPLLPDSSTEFMVDERGIRDVSGKRTRKSALEE